MTPHVYINLLRMELAVKSVMDTDDSLSHVGGDLGFSAQGHFTRSFATMPGSLRGSSAKCRRWDLVSWVLAPRE